MNTTTNNVRLVGLAALSAFFTMPVRADTVSCERAVFRQRMLKLAGGGVPDTARGLEAFRAIPIETSVPDLLRRVGLPDANVGSGFKVYQYRLTSGGWVRVITADDNYIRSISYLPKVGFEEIVLTSQSK